MKIQKKGTLLLCWLIYSLFSLNQSYAITWSAPQTISTMNTGRVDLAINDNDIALATWTNWDGSTNNVVTAFYTGSWQAVSTLSSSASFDSQAKINSNDHAVVAFLHDNGTTILVQACFYDGTSWSAPVTLSSASLNATNLHLAMNDSDEAIAVWRSEGGSSPMIEAAYFDGSTWSASTAISDASTFSDRPQVSMNNLGNAFAIWESFDTVSVHDIQVAFYDGNLSSWGLPTVVSDGTNDSYRPKIAMNSSEDTVAIWQTIPNGTDDSIIRAASYDSGLSSWSSIANVASGIGMIAFSADLSYNDLGHAVAVWTELVSATHFEIYASLSLAPGVWDPATLISDASLSSTLPQVAINDSDEIVASFLSSNGGVNEVHANSYISGGWEGSARVSNIGILNFKPSVVLNNNSISFLGWSSEINDEDARVSQGTFP